MRTVVAIASVILALTLITRPILAQLQAHTPPLESIHMIDSQTGWAVTREPDQPIWADNGFVRTVDGGTHWKDVTPPFTAYGNRFFGPGAGPVEVLSSLFAWVGEYRTIDGGQKWRLSPTPGNITSIHFIDDRNGWLLNFGGSNMSNVEVAVHRSADGGDSWTQIASSRKGDLSVYAGNEITFLNATTGWITQSVPVLRPDWFPLSATVNGGRVWKSQTLPLPPQVRRPWGSGIKRPKFFTARDGLLPILYMNLYTDPNAQSYAPEESFVVLYLTHDSGATWTYTSPLLVKSYCWPCGGSERYDLALSFSDMNHGWVADGEALYATTNGGRGWIRLRPTSFTGAKQLDFVSPQVGWAVTNLASFLQKTMDGGHTWTPTTYTILR